MTSKRQLVRGQRAWATAAGLAVDARGYLPSRDANLRRPLSASALADFQSGGGAELLAHGARPAKMHALHSSAALAVNVFDHWTADDAAPLLHSLGIDAALKSLRFEARFATGLPGMPPNLDVALELASGRVIGIESKFTEWLTRKRPSRPPFKPKYFREDGGLWARNGLPGCQALAADVMSGTAVFRTLDVPQLLKHALGLATQCPGRFALNYLYYDIDCPARAVHAQEIARFADRVGAEVGFEARRYQDLYRALGARTDVDPDYLRYLGTRYFASARM